MANKKSKLDIAAEELAEIIGSHVSTLPRAQAKAMLRDIRAVAAKASRSGNRGKPAQLSKSAGPGPLSRACA